MKRAVFVSVPVTVEAMLIETGDDLFDAYEWVTSCGGTLVLTLIGRHPVAAKVRAVDYVADLGVGDWLVLDGQRFVVVAGHRFDSRFRVVV